MIYIQVMQIDIINIKFSFFLCILPNKTKLFLIFVNYIIVQNAI